MAHGHLADKVPVMPTSAGYSIPGSPLPIDLSSHPLVRTGSMYFFFGQVA